MAKVIFTQNEMPFPEDRNSGNKTSKFRYRIVNTNRNQFSDWSVINFAEQDALKYEGSTVPPGGTTGQVPSKESGDDYDIGWNDVTDLIPPGTYAPGDDYVSPTTDTDKLVPSGGSIDQVLTKNSNTSGDTKWATPYYVPTNGVNAQVLAKVGDGAIDYAWVTLDPSAFGGSGSATDLIARLPYPSGGSVGQYTDTVSGYSYRYHVFNYTDDVQSLTVFNGVIGKLLIVAGGGGGAKGYLSYAAGGGGGGGAFYGDYAFGVGTHNLFIGRGGNMDQNGLDSWFDDIYVYGGGRGGGTNVGSTGGNGGSGGGGGRASGTGGGVPGLAIPGYGSASANFFGNNGNYSNAGGTVGGAGGSANLLLKLTGVEISYGVGGSGGSGYNTGAAGINGRGNGGGGGGALGNLGGAGGHGVVICRYRIA